MNRYSLFGIRATHYVSTCRLKEASTLQYSRATFSAFVIIASNILNGELFFINIFPGSASNIKEWCGTQSDFVTFFLFSRQTLFLSEYRDIWREHSNITSWLDISSTASQNIETESMQIQKFVFFSCMHLECTAYQLSLSEKSETSIIWLLKHDACQQNEIANYIRHNAN